MKMDLTMKPVVKFKLAYCRRSKIPVFEIRLENVNTPIKERIEGTRRAALRATILSRQYNCKCERG